MKSKMWLDTELFKYSLDAIWAFSNSDLQLKDKESREPRECNRRSILGLFGAGICIIKHRYSSSVVEKVWLLLNESTGPARSPSPFAPTGAGFSRWGRRRSIRLLPRSVLLLLYPAF